MNIINKELLTEKQKIENIDLKKEIIKNSKLRSLTPSEGKLFCHSVVSAIKKGGRFNYTTFNIVPSPTYLENPEENTYSTVVQVSNYVIYFKNNTLFLNEEVINEKSLLNIIIQDMFISKGKLISIKNPLPFQEVVDSEGCIDTQAVMDYLEFSNGLEEFRG